jgi:hypothetical protein
MVGAVGAKSFSSWVPCFYHNPPHVHRLCLCYIRGDWAGGYGKSILWGDTCKMEDKVARLVEGMEALPERLVEKMET